MAVAGGGRGGLRPSTAPAAIDVTDALQHVDVIADEIRRLDKWCRAS